MTTFRQNLQGGIAKDWTASHISFFRFPETWKRTKAGTYSEYSRKRVKKAQRHIWHLIATIRQNQMEIASGEKKDFSLTAAHERGFVFIRKKETDPAFSGAVQPMLQSEAQISCYYRSFWTSVVMCFSGQSWLGLSLRFLFRSLFSFINFPIAFFSIVIVITALPFSFVEQAVEFSAYQDVYHHGPHHRSALLAWAPWSLPRNWQQHLSRRLLHQHQTSHRPNAASGSLRSAGQKSHQQALL